MLLNRHHRPVLHSRIVRQAKDGPDNHICVFDIILSGDGVCYATCLDLRLVGELAASPQFAIYVLCDPDVVLGECGALCSGGFLVCKEELCR